MLWADMVDNTSRSAMPDMSACRSNEEDGKEIESSSGHMFEISGMDWNKESQVLCATPEVQELIDHQAITGAGGQGPSSVGTLKACPQEHYQRDETLNSPTNIVDKVPDQTTDTGMTSSCITVMDEVMTEVGPQHVGPTAPTDTSATAMMHGIRGKGDITEAEQIKTTPVGETNRTKKLKIERDDNVTRVRNRSKTRQKANQ